jgi:hypothetical protein
MRRSATPSGMFAGSEACRRKASHSCAGLIEPTSAGSSAACAIPASRTSSRSRRRSARARPCCSRALSPPPDLPSSGAAEHPGDAPDGCRCALRAGEHASGPVPASPGSVLMPCLAIVTCRALSGRYAERRQPARQQASRRVCPRRAAATRQAAGSRRSDARSQRRVCTDSSGAAIAARPRAPPAAARLLWLAAVVELADTRSSGGRAQQGVEVRILSAALGVAGAARVAGARASQPAAVSSIGSLC